MPHCHRGTALKSAIVRGEMQTVAACEGARLRQLSEGKKIEELLSGDVVVSAVPASMVTMGWRWPCGFK
jgi:hypothetical protein